MMPTDYHDSAAMTSAERDPATGARIVHLAARRAASSSPQDRVAAALKLTDEIIGDRPEPRESFAWRVAESIATWTLAVAFCFLLWFLLFFFMVL